MHFDPVRTEKVKKMRERGQQPYAANFERTHSLQQAREGLSDGMQAKVAGRLMLFRDMGKLTFATLQDMSGKLQIAFKEDLLGTDVYKDLLSLIDRGDFIGIFGEKFTTQKGEPTLLVKEWHMLSKALNQPPEKWHGIADQETSWRQRYLEMMSNKETLDRFALRSDFIRLLREFYWHHGFMEVETPVLVNAASGALATPFQTHHAAYDMDVYLRIAPETFLKEAIVGGFDRVFEVARVFRNEGLDPSHLQDFTMVEHYASYWDYVANMAFTEEMFRTILPELIGTTKVSIPDRDGNFVDVDFGPAWPRLTIRDVILEKSGIDISMANSDSALREAMRNNNVRLDIDVTTLGYGNLVDQLYKKVARPHIVQPTFIVNHPIALSPLARRNDQNPTITDRFQLVVGGWEIVNAYSELIDPIDQYQRFDEQAKAHAKGDTDAHEKDDDFVKALSYGCPPCSGWGMGIDRIVALLTRQANLRDVVLFPLMKPLQDLPPATEEKKEKKKKAQKPGPLPTEAKAPDPGMLSEVQPAPEQKPEPAEEEPKGPVTPGRSMPGIVEMMTPPYSEVPAVSPAPIPQQGTPPIPPPTPTPISAAQASGLLQHAEYGHLLPEAHLLLEEHTVQTKAHLLATGAAMEALAKKFGGDPETWKVAGMLHDLDWDNLEKDWEKHCGTTLEQMLSTIKAPQELLSDIRAHYQAKYGEQYPLDSLLRKCLYCVDELTGFIIAVTLVRPSRKIADVEVSSVKKKLKDKTFAAQVDRSQIEKCQELLGFPLEEMIQITLDAMKTSAQQLGL